MSYWCETGNHRVAEGIRCVKYVAERREKQYVEKYFDKTSKSIVEKKGGLGWEIVREGKACEAHAPKE